MYEAMDRHTWVYDMKAIIDKLEKQIDALKEENQELKEKIDEFILHQDDDLNYIDGHYCCREVETITVKCRIIYKDIETGETIATRDI